MINQKEWLEIFKLVKNGFSVPSVAKKVQRSTTAIYRLIKTGGPRLIKYEDTLIPRKIGRFSEYLNKRIKDGVTNINKLLFEIQNLGYTGSYSSLYKFINSRAKTERIEKASVRFETQPGEQAQVDWGSFGKIEMGGFPQRLYCFVYVLGFSRAMYIEFTVKQNLQTFQGCHIHAFEKLGIPKTIVYDNVKTVVLRRERIPGKAPRIHLNPGFSDFASYHGFEIKPCAPYWPRSKGKVEAGVKYVRNNFMEGMSFGRDFFSLEDLNDKAQKWVKNVANERIHGTTNQRPTLLWLEEKPFLSFPKDFPSYVTTPFVVRNSTKDGLIQYKSNFYSVPFEFARRKLFLKEINEGGFVFLEIYYEDKLIARHQLSNDRGKWITDEKHTLLKEKKGVNKKIYKKIKTPFVAERPLSYYDQLILKK